MAPDPSFRHRPLSVAQPFGLTAPRQVDLAEVALEHGAVFLRDALTAVEPESRRVRTSGGRELPYDALLIAIGTRQEESIPGAVTFADSADRGAFRGVLGALDRGEVRRLVFAVPERASWPLGLYELALLTSVRIEGSGSAARLTVVTPEERPLGILGRRASAAVSGLLQEAGVELLTGRTPSRFERGRLLTRDGEISCDLAVTLPTPSVPDIPGIPKQDGFIPVDRLGAVLGLERVYAAGDVTWFPIKQGGLATQQADCAARSIAALAGADVQPEAFRPVLRGALLTSWGPRYLRAEVERPDGTSQGARSTLWWPPAKIAGRFLAPYLAARAGYPVPANRPLVDLDPPPGDDAAAPSTDHEDVVGLALSSAEVDAEAGDFPRALRWLEVAEDLTLYLPPEYERKRASWQALKNG
jgi:sulfide:quinone oxidoreductase